MAYAETTSWECEDVANEGAHVLVTYRVRVCARCGHAACPFCNGSWCDVCIDWGNDDPEVSEQCAEETKCVYDEPDSEAVVEVSRVAKTRAEYEAAIQSVEEV